MQRPPVYNPCAAARRHRDVRAGVGGLGVDLGSAELLRFLLAFIALLAVSRGLGKVARRLGQPEVVGELLAGVLLGPSALGAFWPAASAALFPAAGLAPALLQLVAQLGVILLLLLSGLEVDLELIRRRARPALLVSLGSVAVPFLGGYWLASVLPPALVARSGSMPVFGLFLATAMSVSAIPVIVKILLDLNLMRRDIGQLTVATGVINDTVGWFLLVLVAGAAVARSLPLGDLTVSLAGTGAFAAFCFTIGYRAIRALVTWVDDHYRAGSATLTAVLLVGLAGGAVTQALHVEAFLGAFLVGIQLARIPRVARAARGQLEAMTLGIFAPIFFAVAGLRVDLPSLATPALGGITAAVVAVACVSKLLGTYAGARLARLPSWTAVALGAGLNARGAVQIIVAAVGLELGVLNDRMYSVILVMAVATSVIAPPMLQWALRHLPADPQEEERLRREALEVRSFLPRLRRILVPVRDGRSALEAAEIVAHLAGERAVEAVAFQVVAPPGSGAGPDVGAGVAFSSGSVRGSAGGTAPPPLPSGPSPPALSGAPAGAPVPAGSASRPAPGPVSGPVSGPGSGPVSGPVSGPAPAPEPSPASGPAPGPAGSGVAWQVRRVLSADVAAAVLAEAARDYDLLVVGAPAEPPGRGLFGPQVDAVLQRTPCTSFVLRLPGGRPLREHLHHVLLPTAGTRADLRAAEFAVALAGRTGARITALHVVEAFPLSDPFGGGMAEAARAAALAGRHATAEVAELGTGMGVPVACEVLTHPGLFAGEEIVRFAARAGCDLVLLAAEPRSGGGELYFGRTVDEVVRWASCPTAVLVSPGVS